MTITRYKALDEVEARLNAGTKKERIQIPTLNMRHRQTPE